MKAYPGRGFLAILLSGLLPLVAAGEVPGQQKGPPSVEEEMRQAEGQLVRIAAEHRQAEKAATHRGAWVAGGVAVAGLMVGAATIARRRRSGR